MSDIVFDEQALAKLFDSPDGPIGRDLVRRTTNVRTQAVRTAPVDTGRFRASIGQQVGKEGGDFVGRVGSNVEYARHLEFGTSRMAPRATLRNALEAARR